MLSNYRKKLGIIGGGQLGKMIAYRASLLGFLINVYSDNKDGCAISFADDYTIGNYNDEEKLTQFAKSCDFITTEFENIIPSPSIISNLGQSLNVEGLFVSQNRLREKTLAQNLGIKTPIFQEVKTQQDILNFFNKHGNCIIKTTTLGYDGKGQFVVKSTKDIEKIEIKTQLIAESFVDFELEFSIICTRSASGEIVFFPSAINIHSDGILSKSEILHSFQNNKCVEIARKYTKQIANSFNFIGTMAVEFFLTKSDEKSGDVIFNEIAPRPHNSGHYTIDLCNVCQFENHVRVVCNLPLITPKLLFEGEMINLIGKQTFTLASEYIANANAKIHLYGKKINSTENLSGRKLGHINLRKS